MVLQVFPVGGDSRRAKNGLACKCDFAYELTTLQTCATNMQTARPDEHRLPEKVAIVHDWLPVYAGAERVLEQIIKIFPQADLFSMVDLLPPDQRGFLLDKPVRTSFIQKLPAWARQRYRAFLPLMPYAVEQFDLSGYELVISSSYAVAKGVLTGPDQLHVCYCHSPMRYAWDLQHQYLREAKLENTFKGLISRIMLHYLRIWDGVGQQRVDRFITNSQFVRKRLKKFYRRDAIVIYPPVDTESFTLCERKDDYYLTASRLVPYKMVGAVVDAFAQMPDRELRVIGQGPEFENIRNRATPNVKMMGYQPNDVLQREMQRARAFVFAAEEDFGIVPVEAQACGTPVIAFGRGGAKETVVPGRTGILFHQQTPEAIRAAIEEFEASLHLFDSQAIRKHAEQFSCSRFRGQMESLVRRFWNEFVDDYPGMAD
jgi:glycosyltransferase involved in cell wall biosynthesis